MSFWTKIRNGFELGAATVGGFLVGGPVGAVAGAGLAEAANSSLRKNTSDVVSDITGMPSASEKREQANLINDQIKAYKNQTELTEKQINATRAEKDAQKRLINEKQIRSLRNNYRPAGGFLNNQARAGSDLTSNTGLPNKLGT